MNIDLVPLSWEKLIQFHPNTSLKKRPMIIVRLDDNLDRHYNAIVIKYDENKNVHIRYLDNPYYEDRYWWSANKNNLPGLNPLSYHAKFLGDEYDEMEHLKKSDFHEGGYDDIINYDRESDRFFESKCEYPFLDGIQGNVHVHQYYVSKYKDSLAKDVIPQCIKTKTKIKIYLGKDNLNKIRIPDWAPYHDRILYNILEGLPVHFSPIVRKYHLNKGNKTKINKIIKEFKKHLSFFLTNQLMERIRNKTSVGLEELLNIKYNLKIGKINYNLMAILPFLIKKNIRIFHCSDDNYEIEDYLYDMKKDNFICLMEYKNEINTIL